MYFKQGEDGRHWFLFLDWMVGYVAPLSFGKHQMYEDHPVDFAIRLLRNDESDEGQPCAV